MAGVLGTARRQCGKKEERKARRKFVKIREMQQVDFIVLHRGLQWLDFYSK